MYTLIPEKTALHLKREYRIRVFILLFLFLSLGVWIGIVTLFPSYIVSVTQEKRVLAETGNVEKNIQSTSTTAAIAQIGEANSDITTLENSQDTLMLSSLIEDIAGHRVAGVSINNIQISRSGATATHISIGGNAATRASLVAFENSLIADGRLTKVDLPVDELAQDTNIAFTITLQGTN